MTNHWRRPPEPQDTQLAHVFIAFALMGVAVGWWLWGTR